MSQTVTSTAFLPTQHVVVQRDQVPEGLDIATETAWVINVAERLARTQRLTFHRDSVVIRDLETVWAVSWLAPSAFGVAGSIGPRRRPLGLDWIDGATWFVGWWLHLTAAVAAGLVAVLVVLGLGRLLR